MSLASIDFNEFEEARKLVNAGGSDLGQKIQNWLKSYEGDGQKPVVDQSTAIHFINSLNSYPLFVDISQKYYTRGIEEQKLVDGGLDPFDAAKATAHLCPKDIDCLVQLFFFRWYPYKIKQCVKKSTLSKLNSIHRTMVGEKSEISQDSILYYIDKSNYEINMNNKSNSIEVQK